LAQTFALVAPPGGGAMLCLQALNHPDTARTTSLAGRRQGRRPLGAVVLSVTP
jgi:hypothetical protein